MKGETRRVRKSQAGLGMGGIILWTGFLVLLLLVLHLEVANLASLGGGLESQLYSFVLAENGLEFARSIMQVLDANQLIAGRDGSFDLSRRAGWRNPLSLSQAREFDASQEWSPNSDDGLPWDPTTGARRSRLGLESGQVFIRFSNNPEERPDLDQDGVLIARTMGIAESLDPALAALGTSVRNHATLLEARLRHSRFFQSPAPLILWESGLVNREGMLLNETGPLVGWVGVDDAAAESALQQLASELRVESRESHSAVQNLTAFYRDDHHRKTLFEPDFWDVFVGRIQDFIDPRIAGQLLYLPEGGVLYGPRDGLILHIGEQDMVLEAGSAVTGAVWKISPDSVGAGRLILGAGSRLELNQEAVSQALEALPADLLEFRILFPEMRQ